MVKKGIPYITFWVWSTENWKRGQKFAQMLFEILRKGLKRNTDKYVRDGIKLNTIGNLTKLPQNLVEQIKETKSKSKNNNKIVVTIALNYGGRDEIIRAIKKLAKDLDKKNKLTIDQLDQLTIDQFSTYLDTADLPDPDLIIRTGGEQRLSGFMLWQTNYAEFYFSQTFFPGLTIKELEQILIDFDRRQRRFGQ